MITIEGYINKIIFNNKENNYYILSVFLSDVYDNISSDYLTIVGTFENIKIIEEELYLFKGELKNHPKYGQQLSAITAEFVVKKDKASIISYLTSDNFPGIGQKTAETLVDTLGVNCLEDIFYNKDILYDLKGISKSRKDIIYKNIILNKNQQDIFIKLSELDISTNLINKIYSYYKNKSLDIINKNPYELIDTIKGVNFIKIDNIAEKIGIAYDNENRISYAFRYIINNHCFSSGHTFIKKNKLLFDTFNILYQSRNIYIEKEKFMDILNENIEDGKLIDINGDIFSPDIYYSENYIYQDLTNRLNLANDNINETIFHQYIKEIEKELNIEYDLTQIAAIKNAIDKNISIITGGPGTGKTTIILGIIKMFQKINHLKFSDLIDTEKKIITLCAPTGKAAKRMTETTGLLSSTIHKIIGWTTEDENINEFVSDRKIKSKLVIIDEASMIDIFLMTTLLKTIPQETKIIIVGDAYQLPSIAPGNVLTDLITSKKIPTIELNKIFRQAENSSIINLSHSIKNNIPLDILENFNDREFIITSKKDLIDVIINTYTELLKITTKEKIQILIPIYKGTYGIHNINKMIQDKFNDNEYKITYGEFEYKLEDRVMQLVNRPEDNVFNGDIGIIYDIFKEDNKTKIIVDYDDNFVTYEKQDLSQIILSYATSIHKSQGSEFDYVIIPIIDTYQFIMNKNLMYTAITRAKNKLFICGNYNEFYKAISENNIITRDSYLRKFFNNNISISNNQSCILNYENIDTIDPMIGMDNIKIR